MNLQGDPGVARGVFSGMIWGAVVAGAGVGGLSLAYPDFKPGAPQGDGAMAELSEPAQPATSPETDTETQMPSGAKEMAKPEEDAEADPGASGGTALEAEPASETGDAVAGTDALSQEPMAETGASEPPEDAPLETAEAETDTGADAMAVDAAEPAAPAEADEPEESAADDVAEAAPGNIADEATPSVTEEIIAALPKTEPTTDGTIGNLAPNVTTDRLPSVGNDEEADADSPTAMAPPPLERFAVTVEYDETKPLMSIVLIDDGTTELGFEALESFPYPLTFAVDASASDAAERMASYRASGLEVMAMVSMPQGATAADAEVSMAGYFSAVPEAVAVLEDPGASLQTNRGLSDQVVEILKSSGHGIVFQASGLNTAQKLALREGVASARVFRDFDGSNQSATVIRRFMDQAAFKANQEGAVVMLGRLRAETISALLIWGLADRASRVSLVPVSTVLKLQLAEASGN
ncbi:MAG: divergent polysaccharide deacetylase family protein [Pseudomonadota bacterium]